MSHLCKYFPWDILTAHMMGKCGKLPSGKRLHNELENHHAINGKLTISTGPCSIAILT